MDLGSNPVQLKQGASRLWAFKEKKVDDSDSEPGFLNNSGTNQF